LCGNRDRIVVGVDSSEESICALRWAAREARIRKTHLHVVHCFERDDSGFSMEDLLGKAFVDLPAVHVESLTIPVRAPEALIAASHGAALLVVGAHERGRFGEVFSSLAHRTASLATCPVAVVGKNQDMLMDTRKAITVAVDDSVTARDALWFAANEVLHRGQSAADDREKTTSGAFGCRLHIFHAAPREAFVSGLTSLAEQNQVEERGKIIWPEGCEPDADEPADPPRTFRVFPASRAPLSDAVEDLKHLQWPEKLLTYLKEEILVGPLELVEVEFEIRVVDSHDSTRTVTSALVSAVERSGLLVIGARMYRRPSGTRSLSVTHSVLHRLNCPIVVVPDAREDQCNRVRNATLAMEDAWTGGDGSRLWS
jgi:nucleotide-binding universal stress UspA family protein